MNTILNRRLNEAYNAACIQIKIKVQIEVSSLHVSTFKSTKMPIKMFNQTCKRR